MSVNIYEHNAGNVMSFECLIRLGFFYRYAKEAGTLGLWHHDFHGQMREAFFFQIMGQYCFNGARVLTAWSDDKRPLAGMICEDVPGEGKARQVHLLTAMRPHDAGERDLLMEGCKAGLNYAFEVMGAMKLMGFIPIINQGALKMVRELGFEVRRVVKDCCYFDRLKTNMDGCLVVMERGY